MIIVVERYLSPAGEMLVGALGDKLCLADWACNPRRRAIDRRLGFPTTFGSTDLTRRAITELEQYFAGERTTFDLPLFTPGTPFQQLVWQQLTTIPYGTATSYSAIGRRLGHPGSARATAAAIGANAVSIIIPCHRVIGADGSLTGYAGGTDAKRHLLTLEKALVTPKARN